MKAADAARGARLADMLSQWRDFDKELRRSRPKRDGFNEARGVEISVGDIEDENGIQPDAYIWVDIETGRMIAAAAHKIIKDELKKLGITP